MPNGGGFHEFRIAADIFGRVAGHPRPGAPVEVPRRAPAWPSARIRIEIARVRKRLAAGIRLLVPAIEIGGKQTRMHISKGGNNGPIDRKVDAANIAPSEVLRVRSDLRKTAVRKATYVFAGLCQAPLGALEQRLEGIRLPDGVVELYLEIVGACRKPLEPTLACRPARPRSSFRSRVRAPDCRPSAPQTTHHPDVSATRYSVRRTVRLLCGSRIIPARIKVPVLLEHALVGRKAQRCLAREKPRRSWRAASDRRPAASVGRLARRDWHRKRNSPTSALQLSA